MDPKNILVVFGRRIDQKIIVTLLPRKQPADADAFARLVLADLKGATVHAVESAGGAIVVTMTINGIDIEHTTQELTARSSALSIVCDRAGVKLEHVRRVKTNGAAAEVARILDGG